MRNNSAININNFAQLFKTFFLEQGKSAETLFYSIILKDKLTKISPFTSPLKGVFRRIIYFKDNLKFHQDRLWQGYLIQII